MSIVNSSTARQPRPNAIVLNGHRVEEVNQFTYLCSEICRDGGILSPIWRNSSFLNRLKVRTLKSNVVSLLLYGWSTWKVTKSITTKLQVFVNRCLSIIFHIYWLNIISNPNLLKMAAMQQIDLIIKRHKCGWIGNTLRKDEPSVARHAMQWDALDVISRRKWKRIETWRRTVETEC